MPERAKAASALFQVSKEDAAFLILHGTKDPMVPMDQSERLNAALQAVGVSSTLQKLEGAGHGGKEFNTPEVQEMIRVFLREHLGA